jgi:hypothetical protein
LGVGTGFTQSLPGTVPSLDSIQHNRTRPYSPRGKRKEHGLEIRLGALRRDGEPVGMMIAELTVTWPVEIYGYG